MPRTVRQNILEGARKWKGPIEVSGARGIDRAGRRTTTGGVETGLLAHESRVLHCRRHVSLYSELLWFGERNVEEQDVGTVGDTVFPPM
jgi:hypothetical protein